MAVVVLVKTAQYHIVTCFSHGYCATDKVVNIYVYIIYCWKVERPCFLHQIYWSMSSLSFLVYPYLSYKFAPLPFLLPKSCLFDVSITKVLLENLKFLSLILYMHDQLLNVLHLNYEVFVYLYETLIVLYNLFSILKSIYSIQDCSR